MPLRIPAVTAEAEFEKCQAPATRALAGTALINVEYRVD